MTVAQEQREPAATPEPRVVKVLVWDLDETLWSGTVLEGDDVELRPGVREMLETLDARGILQSIASKNDPEAASERLAELGVDHLFLYPQIGWGAKSSAIRRIAETINVGLDAVAFIDDQPFEREEVGHVHPEVMLLDAGDVADLADLPELQPRFITDESALRRAMYQADAERNRAEEDFDGPNEAFLASLQMVFTIAPAERADLQRAEELTVRTNQLNTTGETYSYDELDRFRQSDEHLLLVAGLTDRYGTYGKIGLALVELGEEVWDLRLLLMSCRVMSRGVGTVLIRHIIGLARHAGVRLRAQFRSNGRNRMMLVSYKFSGFREVGREGDSIVFENDYRAIQPVPEYVDLRLPAASSST